MGGNALSESLVFGVLAARSAVAVANGKPISSGFEVHAEMAASKRFANMEAGEGEVSVTKELRKELARLLWEKIGIVRNGELIKQGIGKIDEIIMKSKECGARNAREFSAVTGCKNAALTARSIAVSALKRRESRGAHCREEFPEEVEDWCKHITVKMVDGLPCAGEVVSVSGASIS
jgi:succinate dehydrogenase/fumarate reductase flavoprotein subunit